MVETIITPLLLPLIGYTSYRDQKKPRKHQLKPTNPEATGKTKEQLELAQQDKVQTTKNPEETPEDGGVTKEQPSRTSEDKDRSRDIFGMRTSTFPH